MSLIRCPECSKETSSEAHICPACGHPLIPSEQAVEKQASSFRLSASKGAQNKNAWALLVLLAAAGVLISTQITVFMIPPIGAVPEGKTLIISRMDKTQFIDSPDAMCERMQGGVNLLCRGLTLAAIIEKATIYLRLPYVESLYLLSTSGQTYAQQAPAAAADPATDADAAEVEAQPVATPPTETPAAAASSAPDPNAPLVAVVRSWQDVKRNAFVNKDSSQLGTVLTGKALEQTEGGVNWWKNNGTFHAIELHGLDVVNVQMLSPTQAKIVATVSETKDNSVQGRQTSTYDATYTLEQENNVWRISSMEAAER